jgi:hypothetical protein
MRFPRHAESRAGINMLNGAKSTLITALMTHLKNKAAAQRPYVEAKLLQCS